MFGCTCAGVLKACCLLLYWMYCFLLHQFVLNSGNTIFVVYNIGKRNVLTESGGVVKNRYIPTSHLPLHSYISGWLYLLQEDQAVSTVPGSKRTICMDDDFSLA